MSAPSLLADNPSARIEIVQGGGGIKEGEGSTFSGEELKILTQYGLQPGGVLDDVISPLIKKQFLEQLVKSNCAIGTGDNIILNSECSAVAQVIRAMIVFNMKRTNGWGPKNLKISAKLPSVIESKSQVKPPPVPLKKSNSHDLISIIQSRIDEKHNGLNNCGNTCYLNSALQMFSYVPELVNESSKNEILYSIFSDLYSLPFKSINLANEERKRLKIFNDIFPVITTQQDVTEFISRFYDKFEFDTQYFKIKEIQQIKCVNPPPSNLGLPDKTPVEVLTNNIILPIENGDSIQTLLDNIQIPVPLDNIENCLTPGSEEEKGPATKETHFEIPEENRYLNISLSRFRLTETGEEESSVPVYERINDSIEINKQITLGGVNYQLYGTINQMGTLKGGHYVFIKIKSDFSGSIIYNDETVTEQDTIPDLTIDSYVVIYKRMNISEEAAMPTTVVEEPLPAASEGEFQNESMPNINAPVSNENAPSIIENMVNMLMDLDPTQRKITSINGINAQVKSTIDTISMLPNRTQTGLIPEDMNDMGQIKIDKIKNIVRNFNNYSKADLLSVVERVKNICLDAVKDEDVLNSGDNERIRQTLTFIEGLLRELDILEYNIKQHIRMNNSIGNPFAESSAEALPLELSVAAESVNYPDEYYETNPPNFQPGHLRINFKKTDYKEPENRQLFANAIIGTTKTRIYGKNTRNIKRKFNSKTRKLKAAANRAEAEAEVAKNKAAKALEAAKAAKTIEQQVITAQKEERKRQEQEARNKEESARRTAMEKAKQNKAAADAAKKALDEARKAQIAANIAAGKKVSLMNKLRVKFSGGRTRRKTRVGRKSRRSGRK